MSEQEVEKIKTLFKERNIPAKYLEHKEVITSEDAARTRGFQLKQGIKAILFKKENNEYIIVNVPADKKVDLKKVAIFLIYPKNKINMASPEEVLEKTGCLIGSVPPFCHKEKIQLFVDTKIYDNEESSFNIGLRTHSVIIKTKYVKDIFSFLNAVEGDFST